MQTAKLARGFRAIEGKEHRIAVGVLIAVNAYGLAALFSDLGPMEPFWLRIATIAVLYAIGGTATGALLPKAWHMATLACGSSTLLGAFTLSMRLRTDGPPPYWAFIVLVLMGPPAIALTSGYLGSRLRRRLEVSAAEA